MINNHRKYTQNANRSFKQIAKNLSGSDYIRNKRSKEIYRTYRGSSDKVNENVRLEYKRKTDIIDENGTNVQEIMEFKGLASVASYDMLRSLIHGKDISYTMSGGQGTSAISLQNLESANETWKGSLLQSQDGLVSLIKESEEGFNVSLFQQSIYGTNGPVGCITENSSSMNFSCCHTPGTSSNPTKINPPSSTSHTLDTMYVLPGQSGVNSVPLSGTSGAFQGATYYEYVASPNVGIDVETVISNEGNQKVEVTISPQVAIGGVYHVTVIPFNSCGETGITTQTFDVNVTPPPPTPTGFPIGTITIQNGDSGTSAQPLTAYFYNAYGFSYEIHTPNLSPTFQIETTSINGEKYISVFYSEEGFAGDISITVIPKNVEGDKVTSAEITFTVEVYT